MERNQVDPQFVAIGNKIHELFANSSNTETSTPKPVVVPFPSKNSSSDEQKQESNEYTKEQEQILKEERKMFFYYPKYLHPESVALIAQHLLDEWEDKAKQYNTLQKELTNKK